MTFRNFCRFLAIGLLASLSTTVAAQNDAAPINVVEPEDDGPGIFYIRAQAGYSYANLVSLRETNFIPEAENVSGSGFGGSLGLGARIAIVGLGANANFHRFETFDLASVGLDIAIHLPIPFISPYLRLGIGYAWVGSADFSTLSGDVSVDGLMADFGLGLDIQLIDRFSIGAGVDATFLNLTRQGIAGAGSIATIDVSEDGDSLGFQLRASLRLTVHI